MIHCYRYLICLCLMTSAPSAIYAQVGQLIEDCANAIDDDGDGLIDINDPDCDCPIVEPVSLIPNPSFEDRTCCPSTRGQMNCAVDWIQASEPTTDYLHSCGWMGWDDLPVPLPLPHGDAVVGFRNGRFGTNSTNPNWKEYAGACLLAPLRAGISYKFQFYIGFTNSQNSPPTNIVFYGSTNCNNLPFGVGNAELGCPTNTTGWKRMGSIAIAGTNEWQLREINVTPSEDIYAMAIGPDCIEISGRTTSTYYFFDNLVLAEQSAFELEIVASDQLCAPDLTLNVPKYDTLNYQWYKDGIALAGEKSPNLSKMYGNGDYQVRLLGIGGSCRITDAFSFIKPETTTEKALTICDGDIYTYLGKDYDQPGIYADTIKTAFDCDSIIQLNLDVFVDPLDTISAKIFPSEFYQLGTQRYYEEGEYEKILTSKEGCDSTIFLNLSLFKVYIPNAFTPNGDGINDIYTIMGSHDLVSILNFRVFNRWGNLIYHANELPPNNPLEGWDGRQKGRAAPEGVYVFTAELLYDDGEKRMQTGSFTLLR